MPWKGQKLLLIGIAIVLLCAMAFLFGVAFGASSDLNAFKDTILPVLSTVGTWVSGIGALGAVLVALWLAEKQRQRDKESLNIDFDFVIFPWVMNPVLAISAVSVGNRPSNIHSISIYSENAEARMALVRFMEGSAALPTMIGYGEKVAYFCETGFDRHIAAYLKRHADGSAKGLSLTVSTTTENFNFVPSNALKKHFEQLVPEVDAAPSREDENG
ncbi:hypothetical protein [Onishia niordana]|uniref:hypothetical protein n=1 Tax=Onishia niordana TaxID=2508711 RepID=UPI00109F7EC7|nr:hypothetical protein [Halomonas niordiana]